MALIEPGEKFPVGYGNGKSVEVQALGMRKKREALKILKVVQAGGEPDAVFGAIEAMLLLSIPDMQDDFLDSINESMAMEIVTKAIKEQSLSEDERKKSESPHS